MAEVFKYFSHLPAQKESNISHPCLWFEDLIKVKEPYRFRENFYKIADEHHELLGGDTDYLNSVFTFYSEYEIEGKKDRFKLSYLDFFHLIVNYQINRSKELISEKIETCQTQEQAKLVLQNIINQLELFILQLKKLRNHPIREFHSIPLGIYELILYLKEAHSSFVPNPLPAIFIEAENPDINQFSNLYDPTEDDVKFSDPIVESEKHTEPETNSENTHSDLSTPEKTPLIVKINSFSWINSPLMYSTLLYQILLDHKVIDIKEIDLGTFHKAFSGEKLSEYPGIKWHLKSSQKSFKAPIIRLLKTLMNEHSLLNKVSDSELAKMIEICFVDEAGQRLTSVHSSIIEIGKSKSMEENAFLKSLGKLTALNEKTYTGKV